jgi:hypothetical protein
MLHLMQLRAFEGAWHCGVPQRVHGDALGLHVLSHCS